MSVELLETRALLTITFQFNYAGEITDGGSGFEDINTGQARRDALELAGLRLGSIFDRTATITMGVTSSDNAASTTLASAGTNFPDITFDGFEDNSVVRTKILTGFDGNGTVDDGSVDVNWGQPWELSSNAADISDSEFDYFATIYHELLHAVGFTAIPNEAGQDILDAFPDGQTPGVWSYFDQFITDVAGTPIISSGGVLDTAAYNANKLGGASPNSGLFFNGPKARAANGDNPVGLYTPAVWESGSSVAHLDDENPALKPLMMAAATDTGPGAQNLSTLERAILEDLGYMLISGSINVMHSEGSTSVTESGSTDYFDVVLSTQPLVDVVLNVTSSNVNEATVNVTTLTFTPSDWNVAQQVIVTGVDDFRADGSQVSSIILTVDAAMSDDAYDFAASAAVPVSTMDDDVAGFTVTQADGTTVVSESGTTDTFTVVLTSQPATDVVLNVVSGNTGEATVDTATLTFTSENWNVTQTVTVTGVDDSNIDGNQTTSITLSVDDASSDDVYDALADQIVSVTTTDDDTTTAGFTVTASGDTTAVSESGTTDTLSVVLTSQPTSDVVINVVSVNTGEVTVDKATLTFTSTNWNDVQTVIVTGVDDHVVDGIQATAVTFRIDADLSDDAFDAVLDQSVSVTTADDDVDGFTVTQTEGTTVVSESGTTDTFEVVLTSQPAEDVLLNVVSGNTGEATVDVATLTFTSENWNVVQTVTVTGINDDVVDGDQATEIIVSVDAAASADAYGALAAQIVSVTTTDDDVVGFTVSQSDDTTVVSESGTTDTFTVVLTSQPATDVVLNVVSGNTGEATVDKATLTFTSENWNAAQVVTVTGIDDANIDGHQTTAITLSVDADLSDDAYDALADQVVSVTTTDNDAAPGFTITQTGDITVVSESRSTDTFEVVLTAQPATDVVLTVVSSDVGEAVVDVATLTFNSVNWSVPQVVTVTGVDDAGIDGDQTSTITVSVDDANSDDAYDVLADQTVSVLTTDNELLSKPILTGPTGAGISTRPTVQWQAVAGAETYQVWINQIGTPNTIAFRQTGITGTSFTLPADLPTNARFVVWVRAHTATTSSVYSESLSFSVGTIPGSVALTAPSGTSTALPTFQWTSDAQATHYDLWVNQIGGTTRIIRERTLAGNSFTAASSLPEGEYKAWIRASNAVGNGPWSAVPITFSIGVKPGTVSVTGPTGTSTARPTIQWTAATNAASYELWVNQVGGTTRIIHDTAVSGTSFSATTDLPSGLFRTWVRAVSSAGVRGPWSPAVDFTV